MKGGRLLGKTRSALMLLMFLTAQTHFSALAQPAPGGQHSALLASYAKRPPWKVAGVDHAVGVPSTATPTDWRFLSGPGITVNTTAPLPYVCVDNTRNVIISGVDFSLHGGMCLLCQFPKSDGYKMYLWRPEPGAPYGVADLFRPRLARPDRLTIPSTEAAMGLDHRLSARPAPER
jgi:hypothetical protein